MPAQLPTPDWQHSLRTEEFRALRATIRERSTLRIALASLGLAAWAALHLAVQVWLPMPVTLLVPLLALAVLFEAVFALHIGVERIGRYLEAAYESDAPDGPRWEHTAHAFGRTMSDSAGRLDPLFSVAFVSAALLNLVPVVMGFAIYAQWGPGPMAELTVYGGLHLVFIFRVMRARQFAARQRRDELEQFERLTQPD